MPPFRLSLFGALLSLSALPAQAEMAGCDYEIIVHGASANSLDITITCAEGVSLDELRLADSAASAFITRKVAAAETAQFHIDLAAFAAQSDDYDGALRIGRSLLVSPSAILPIPQPGDIGLRLHVKVMDGADLAIALPQDASGAFVLRSGDVEDAGEWVLGRFESFSLAEEGEMQVATLDAPIAVSQEELRRWIGDVAASNRRFWGAVPVAPALVAIIPVTGKKGLPFGRVMAGGGATILLLLGAETSLSQLYDEWVLVHEFLHLGSPLMRDTGIWLNEGIATYFEPILRARAGWKSEDAVWHEWLLNMQRGLPALTETGLKEAPSRRSYWGGALFLLLADIQLRRHSGGRVGTEDCLRAVLQEGADVRQRWLTETMLSACEAATGHTGVLNDLAQKYVYGHHPLDLDQVWRDLGVSLGEDGSIHYDDTAPLAAVRQSIVWGDKVDWPPIGQGR